MGKCEKRLVGSITGNGTVLLEPLIPIPTRESAVFGVIDHLPQPHFSLASFSKASVHATAATSSTIALEVTNFDPNDPASPWESIDSITGVTGPGDLIQVSDLSVAYGRVVTSATSGAEVEVVVELT